MQALVLSIRLLVLKGLIPCFLLLFSGYTLAHDIPTRVTVYSFVKPEGNQLNVLLRVPMEALGEIVFPTRGPGYLIISEADFELQDAARVYITESIAFFENGGTDRSVC